MLGLPINLGSYDADRNTNTQSKHQNMKSKPTDTAGSASYAIRRIRSNKSAFIMRFRSRAARDAYNERIVVESLRSSIAAQQISRFKAHAYEATALLVPSTMKQITARKFKAAVKLDPAWALTLTEPVEITDYCNMTGSKISHLSQMLHFAGGNKEGDAASFACCHHLKVAEGTFNGFVNFSESGVEKIGNLQITAPNKKGAASFSCCKNLKVAEGTFPGCVCFKESGITRIGELNITAPSAYGFAADFFCCKSLELAEGTFPGLVDFALSGIKKIGELTITQPHMNGIKAIFFGCDIRLPSVFLGPEYKMNDSTRQKNLRRIAAGNALKGPART